MRAMTLLAAVAIASMSASTVEGDGRRASSEALPNLANLEPGAPCPTGQPREVIAGFAPAVGRQPVYATTFGTGWPLLYDPNRHDGGWYSVKVLWLGDPAFAASVRLTGKQLDGDGDLRFGPGAHPKRALRLRSGHDASSTLDPTGWSDWPSSVRVKGPGCYTIRVVGTNVRYQVVFNLAPKPPVESQV